MHSRLPLSFTSSWYGISHLIKPTLGILSILALEKLYLLVDHAFVAHLGSDFGRALSYISFLNLPFFAIGLILGQLRLEDLKQGSSSKGSRRDIYLILSLLIASPIVIFREPLILASQVASFDLSTSYWLQILSAFLVGFNTLSYLDLISKKKFGYSFSLHFLCNSVNFLGNMIAIHSWEGANAFESILATTVITNFVFFLGSTNFKKTRLHFPRLSFDDLDIMFSWESLHTILIVFLPLVYTIALESTGQGQLVTAFNISYRITDLLLSINLAVLFNTVSSLNRLWKSRNQKDWELVSFRVLQLTTILSGAAIFLTFSLANSGMSTIFNLTNDFQKVFVNYSILALVPWALANHWWGQLRALERTQSLGMTYLVSFYLISLPISYHLLQLGYIQSAIFSATVLPSLIRFLGLKLSLSGSIWVRRKFERFQIVTGLIPVKIQADHYTIEGWLINISVGGALIGTSEENKLRIGDTIEGQLEGVNSSIAFTGRAVSSPTGYGERRYSLTFDRHLEENSVIGLLNQSKAS